MSMTRSEINAMRAAALGGNNTQPAASVDLDKFRNIEVAAPKKTKAFVDGEYLMEVVSVDFSENAKTHNLQAKLTVKFVNGERAHNLVAWITFFNGGLTVISELHCKFNGKLLTEGTMGEYIDFVSSLAGKQVTAWISRDRENRNLLRTAVTTWKAVK